MFGGSFNVCTRTHRGIANGANIVGQSNWMRIGGYFRWISYEAGVKEPPGSSSSAAAEHVAQALFNIQPLVIEISDQILSIYLRGIPLAISN